MNTNKKKNAKILLLLLSVPILIFGFIIYNNNEKTIHKQILKQLEKETLIYNGMQALQVKNIDSNTTEYIYKDNTYYYFFNFNKNEDKNYDIYVYVENNDKTPIMPTYLNHTDENAHYIYITAKNECNFLCKNYKINIEKVVPKK